MIGLLALTSIPTVTGVSLASSEQRKANQRREEARRMVKFNIYAECDGDTDDDRKLNGMTVVVRDEKVGLTGPLSSVKGIRIRKPDSHHPGLPRKSRSSQARPAGLHGPGVLH